MARGGSAEALAFDGSAVDLGEPVKYVEPIAYNVLPQAGSFVDDGSGVPEELAEHLFLPLVSGRADGSGLGLAIVAAIVGQHQGDVDVRETPGGGATFHVVLPGATPVRPARV